ncbi:MAG: alpha/beta hydrolase [Planctomycetota bacterium]|nr:alpha/beta hydrolase [Planctomycetota bacterium]
MTTRRRFLGSMAAATCASSVVRSWGAEVIRTTYTYKTVGDLPIKLDVHRPAGDETVPLIVWIHGGALINGHREGVSGRVLKMALEAGYAVASIDYRLAPETQLPDIIEDVEDAFDWLHKNSLEQFGASSDRIAVAGGSAGGYLTLATGYRVRPRPTVLVSFWGYGDLVGSWYSTPSPHPRHHQSTMTEVEARKQVAGPPISDSRQRQGNGGAFYQFCRQTGRWPLEVSGWDPMQQARKFYPFMPVKNVNRHYPPTMLIHGTNDTDVPYEQSEWMARQFERHGVEFKFASIAGGEHGLGGGNPAAIDRAYLDAMAFIKSKMQP